MIAGHDFGMLGSIVGIKIAVSGGDDELSSIRHGISCIGGEIGKRRLKLRRIGDNRRESRAEVQ